MMASLGCTNGFAVFNDDLSEGCILGKMQRLSFKRGHEKATAPGQRIHSDVCGPIQVITPAGNRYFGTFKDDFSSYCTKKLLKKKSEVAVTLQNFVATVKNKKREGVRCIGIDNGGEYLSGELQSWLKKEGINHEKSIPYTPQQNGVAERTNWTLMEAARSMLYGKKVPLELWEKL